MRISRPSEDPLNNALVAAAETAASVSAARALPGDWSWSAAWVAAAAAAPLLPPPSELPPNTMEPPPKEPCQSASPWLWTTRSRWPRLSWFWQETASQVHKTRNQISNVKHPARGVLIGV